MGEATTLQKIIQTAPSKALVIRINFIFLAFFLLIYASLLFRPSSSVYFQTAASLVRCSLSECHPKVERGLRIQQPIRNVTAAKLEVPAFVSEIGIGMRIGTVNLDDYDVSEWRNYGEIIPITFERVSELFEWPDLFPEWIDEEEEMKVPSCPEIPMPDFQLYRSMDLIVAELPCKYPEKGWARDVERLQVHMVAAHAAVQRGWSRRMKVVFRSKCRPMVELFRCNEVVKKEGDWWYYQPEVGRLEHKLALPIGSCTLALPLWDRGNTVYDMTKLETNAMKKKKKSTSKVVRVREAYATVLHSSEAYVCGAITLAQSLLNTGTRRDLLLLLDTSISAPKRAALIAAGWNLRFITRIRNPRAEKNTYNEYNYSKFRLWQLTDYQKIVFIDADIIVLRNLDLLFQFPEMSARGNDLWIFNSGIMVIEPANCTFKHLMKQRKEIISYNGGDQGFLNEVFVWWHRVPRRVNYLKNFWSNSTVEAGLKNQMFGSDPPKVYSIHYLGLKPWQCYRDYDCNWDIEDQRVYASDVAHARWWKLHDAMDDKLQRFCGLTEQRRIELDWDRKLAREKYAFGDGHWKINITDPRRTNLIPLITT